MSVDTRVHIDSGTLQERAVLRRTTVWQTTRSGYRNVKAVAIKGHTGEEVRISVRDLGAALRVLKLTAKDLAAR